jgi:hypothetical protein
LCRAADQQPLPKEVVASSSGSEWDATHFPKPISPVAKITQSYLLVSNDGVDAENP